METGRIPEGTKEDKPRTAAEIIAESPKAQQEIAAKAETEDQTDNEAGQEETTEATAAETTEI